MHFSDKMKNKTFNCWKIVKLSLLKLFLDSDAAKAETKR